MTERRAAGHDRAAARVPPTTYTTAKPLVTSDVGTTSPKPTVVSVAPAQ